MESKIDHAEQARNLIGANMADWRDGAIAIAQATEAQVHATLAVAEQQKRIADWLENVATGPNGRPLIDSKEA